MDLKNRNNDLFDKEKAADDGLRSIGRDPDHPSPAKFAGLPHIDASPWAKRDNGDVETALINFPPDEHVGPSNLVPGPSYIIRTIPVITSSLFQNLLLRRRFRSPR